MNFVVHLSGVLRIQTDQFGIFGGKQTGRLASVSNGRPVLEFDAALRSLVWFLKTVYSPMISEIHAKSILRKQKKVESWFVSRYGMNLYRGCTHNCAYCDGRAEKYNVDGEFGKDIAVKSNALEVLRRELDPSRKRKPMPRGFMFVGGGVCDSYQPAEATYHLTRQKIGRAHV